MDNRNVHLVVDAFVNQWSTRFRKKLHQMVNEGLVESIEDLKEVDTLLDDVIYQFDKDLQEVLELRDSE